MKIQKKRLIGLIAGDLLTSPEVATKDLKIEVHNQGFDGEKYESSISFQCNNKEIANYEGISLSAYLGEIEIEKLIKTLKAHLKANRKNKKLSLKHCRQVATSTN